MILPALALLAATLIPIESHELLILVPVRVDGGKPLTFLLDTAAPATYFDPCVMPKRSSATIDAGGLRFTARKIRSMDLAFLETSEGRRIDGVLGGELFEQYAVEIDYDSQAIRLHDAAAFQYHGAGQSLPVIMRNGKPYVAATLKLNGRELTREYLIDTGSAGAIADDAFQQPAAAAIGPDLGRAESFTLGRFRFEGMNGTSGGPLIGGELLHRFNVICDFAHRRVILEPSRHYADAFLFDTSGLEFEAAEKGFRIVRVYPRTPGAESGLRSGDVIMRIDNVRARDLGLVRARLLFHQVRDHELRIERGGTPMTITLHLRTLL